MTINLFTFRTGKTFAFSTKKFPYLAFSFLESIELAFEKISNLTELESFKTEKVRYNFAMGKKKQIPNKENTTKKENIRKFSMFPLLEYTLSSAFGSWSNLDTFPFLAMISFAKLPRLRSLDFGFCNGMNDETLMGLAAVTQLTHLTLFHGKRGRQGIRSLSSISPPLPLTSLLPLGSVSLLLLASFLLLFLLLILLLLLFSFLLFWVCSLFFSSAFASSSISLYLSCFCFSLLWYVNLFPFLYF